MANNDPETVKAVLSEVLPSHSLQTATIVPHGWDSTVIDLGDTILKFPRDAEAETRLRLECAMLQFLTGKITLPIPHMILRQGNYVFSEHAKLPGECLTTPHYDLLDDHARNELANMIATFFAEMHSVPLEDARNAGAGGLNGWLPPDQIAAKVKLIMGVELEPFIDLTMARYKAIDPAPSDMVFGHFDCHGENMAFDREHKRLAGLFDFADCGIGDFHKDLHCINWISSDLTAKIIPRYQAITGRTVDEQRVTLYSTVCRLSDLAEQVDNPLGYGKALEFVEEWYNEMMKAG